MLLKISSELIADGRENCSRSLDSTEVKISCQKFKFQDITHYVTIFLAFLLAITDRLGTLMDGVARKMEG